MREIKISKCMNGYIVNVGCQTIVFESKEKMLVELSRFLNNPEEVEKEYVEKFGQEFENPGLRPPQTGDVPRVRGESVTYGGAEAYATAREATAQGRY